MAWECGLAVVQLEKIESGAEPYMQYWYRTLVLIEDTELKAISPCHPRRHSHSVVKRSMRH